MLPRGFPIENEQELRDYLLTHDFPNMDLVPGFPIANEQELREYFLNHDPLTLLRNRTSLRKEFSNLREEHYRSALISALFLVDLDCFKNYNDLYGMRAADKVLIEAALRLRDEFESHLLARIGGDEFVGILGGPTSVQLASAIAERLVEAFRAPLQIVVSDLSIDVIQPISLGVVLWASPFVQFETLLDNANLALTEAKRQGGGRFVINPMDAAS